MKYLIGERPEHWREENDIEGLRTESEPVVKRNESSPLRKEIGAHQEELELLCFIRTLLCAFCKGADHPIAAFQGCFLVYSTRPFVILMSLGTGSGIGSTEARSIVRSADRELELVVHPASSVAPAT